MFAYEPDRRHWYLRQTGVDPALQGNGIRSALIEAGLAAIDDLGEPAYLETTSPGSRALYERYGFKSLAEIQVGGAPSLWPMARG